MKRVTMDRLRQVNKPADPIFQELYAWAFLDCIERMFNAVLRAEERTRANNTLGKS